MLAEVIGNQRKVILPTPDVLHDRSKIRTDMVEVEPGTVRPLHRFESSVTAIRTIKDRERTIRDPLGREVGLRHWDDVVTLDGIDRGVTTYVPHDEYRNDYSLSLVMDTAWLTGLEGHNDLIAETFMKELGVSVVVIGPEYSAARPREIGAQMKLGKLASQAAGFSLMKSGEAAAEIYATLLTSRPEYDLKHRVIGAGESRAAMIEQIRRRYMTLHGIETIHSDITDPCVNEQALLTPADILKAAKWPMRECMGALAVGLARLKRGDLHREIGTVPVDYRHLVGAILGTGPSLLSGEEGMFAEYTPFSHPQHIVNFNQNSMADTAQRRKRYDSHFNSTEIELNGYHLGLGFPSVQRHVIDRTHAIGAANAPIVDWKREIHSKGRKQVTFGFAA